MGNGKTAGERKVMQYTVWFAAFLMLVMVVILGIIVNHQRIQLNNIKQKQTVISEQLNKANTELKNTNSALNQEKKVNAQKDKQIKQLQTQVNNENKQIVALKRLKQSKLQAPTTSHSIVALSGRSGGPGDFSFGQTEVFKATWYSLSGRTAIGAYTTAGKTIAVDPSVIPLGSLVQIEFSNGTTHIYTAQDTGGAIHGNRIDIYDPSESDCVSNGVQYVRVRVISTK